MLGFLAPYRLYAYLALAVALGGAYWYWHHSVYTKGHTEGAASVQGPFDAYRAEVTRLTEQRRLENAAKEAKVKATNEAVENGYKQALAAIANDRDSLARRVRDYQARTCSPILPTPEHLTGSADASSQPPSEAEFDRLYDAYDQACRSDSAQLNALIEQVRGQM